MDANEAAFLRGMVWIIKRIRERVAEDGGSLFKRDAVFCKITGSFVFIPLKSHGSQ